LTPGSGVKPGHCIVIGTRYMFVRKFIRPPERLREQVEVYARPVRCWCRRRENLMGKITKLALEIISTSFAAFALDALIPACTHILLKKRSVFFGPSVQLIICL
jgi:hypothetical protein